MRKIASAILVAFISFSFLSFANSEDKKSNETELNFFTGMFDFSDDKQAAGVLGLQHQNDDLFRKSFLGRLSPITGGFLTEKTHFIFILERKQNMILDYLQLLQVLLQDIIILEMEKI